MARKPSRFDTAEQLDSDEAVAAFIHQALAARDPASINEALRIVARAIGMSHIARQADLSHQRLFRALAEPSKNHTSTIARALRVIAQEAEQVAMSSDRPPRGL